MTVSSSRWLPAVLALLVPLPARADPPSAPPSEEQVEAGRVLFREARELRKQGRVKEALDKALEAYRTAPTPVTALEASDLLVEAGRLVEARDLVRSVATMPVSPRESEKGRDARQQAATLAASLDARIPKIAVGERPRGVDMLLDGKPFTAIDASEWQGVDPGPHTVIARLEERTCATISITLTEGEARTIDLREMGPACRPPPTAPEPPRGPERAPGRDAPRAEAAAAGTREEPRPSSDWRWTGAAMAGAGAIALGAGAYLALHAKGDYDSVSADCPPRGCTSHAYDVRQSARSQADVATVVLALGAAGVAGGALLWFLTPGGGRVALGPASVHAVVEF
jgi:hypothetical protein